MRARKETALLYHAYELQRAWLNGASAWASITAEMLSNPRNPMGYLGMSQTAASALEVFAHATQPRGKPSFDIDDGNGGRQGPLGDRGDRL